MKKIIITISLVLYTAAMLLGFIFIPKHPNTAPANAGKSVNDEWVQTYSLVELSVTQLTVIRTAIAVDITALAQKGYDIYSEEYYAPYDWRKEVHKAKWSFEKIYCDVEILMHEDEIGWERTRPGRVGGVRSSAEIDGMTFITGTDYLAFDDTAKGIYFIFRCSEDAKESVIFQDFLSIFFNKGEAA